MKTFLERLKEPKPMIYDGGFGSELFANGIELANSALANEQYPQAVVDIHTSYINAGTDAIGTNTFVVSPLHLEMAGKSPGASRPPKHNCANGSEIFVPSLILFPKAFIFSTVSHVHIETNLKNSWYNKP